jgi:hypothetical protein
LQVDPAKQSVYYQQQSAYFQEQSAAILAQISLQLASIAPEVSTPTIAPQISTLSSIPSTAQQVLIPSTSPPPYSAFKPSFSDIRVSTYWLAGLVCSLLAALLAIIIRQWVRSYMQVFQRYDHPLKRARFRQFFFEGANGIRNLASTVPRLIHVALFLFFLGLGDSILHTNTTVGVTTVVLICIGGSFYLHSISAHLWNVQSPYQSLILRPIFFLKQKFMPLYFSGDFRRKPRPPMGMEAYQEHLVMEDTEERKACDVDAIRWLVDSAAAKAEMEPLILAIPGSLNTEWGREVWTIISQGRSNTDTQEGCSLISGQASLTHYDPLHIDGATIDTICRSMRYLFETCDNHSYFPNEDARRRRMRACVEAAASLVCCIDFRADWFGEVGKLVGDIGRIEKVNQSPTTASDPLFIIRWTFLSLVLIQPILGKNRLKVLAGYAVSGLTRVQLDLGQPEEAALKSAQKIDECLRTAWEHVEDLHRAFEPWEQKKTKEQVEDILRSHERQISELEHIKVDSVRLEDVDWRISLYQNAMDDATYKMTRHLPGVSFDELRRPEPVLLSDTWNMSGTGNNPVTPQLIFSGQHIQALARLGLKLREALEGQTAEGYEEVLENLKTVDKAPLSLRRPNGLMKRQLWRLQDLRDGGGLGFTTELFFLSLKHILTIPSLHESNRVFYIGAFKIITSHWMEGRESIGTHRILLNIICDLIIEGRGIFSDFVYPESITSMLLDMVGNMLQGYAGPDGHIRDALREIEDVDFRICTDVGLRRRALAAIPLPQIP